MAETLRLKKLQQPSQVQGLLDALIVRAGLVPLVAYQINTAASVPRELQKVAKLAVHSGRAWSCWAHGTRTWLFTGDMPLDVSRERGRPVLRVDAWEDAELKDSGLWMPDRDGKWQRCAD